MSITSARLFIAAALASATLLSACAAPVTHTTRIYESADSPAHLVPVARYVEYGTIRRIDVEETHQGVTGGGAVLGALVGGLLGNTIGRGGGRGAATALGAVGGGFLGNRIEHNEARSNSGTRYVVVVRLDNGSTRRFDIDHRDGFRVGERVRIDGGELLPA
jgi:outer membrane lipoprotein SlyB